MTTSAHDRSKQEIVEAFASLTKHVDQYESKLIAGRRINEKGYSKAIDDLSNQLENMCRINFINLTDLTDIRNDNKNPDIRKHAPESHQQAARFSTSLSNLIKHDISTRSTIKERILAAKRWAAIMETQLGKNNFYLAVAIKSGIEVASLMAMTSATLDDELKDKEKQVESLELGNYTKATSLYANLTAENKVIIPGFNSYKGKMIYYDVCLQDRKDRLKECEQNLELFWNYDYLIEQDEAQLKMDIKKTESEIADLEKDLINQIEANKLLARPLTPSECQLYSILIEKNYFNDDNTSSTLIHEAKLHEFATELMSLQKKVSDYINKYAHSKTKMGQARYSAALQINTILEDIGLLEEVKTIPDLELKIEKMNSAIEVLTQLHKDEKLNKHLVGHSIKHFMEKETTLISMISKLKTILGHMKNFAQSSFYGDLEEKTKTISHSKQSERVLLQLEEEKALKSSKLISKVKAASLRIREVTQMRSSLGLFDKKAASFSTTHHHAKGKAFSNDERLKSLKKFKS